MKILITGGCGFIGSNFIRRYVDRHPDHTVVNLDALTYAGNPDNLQGISGTTYKFVHGNICSALTVEELFEEYKFDAVVHFAAESHVDRSIKDPELFLNTNVNGTRSLLSCAQKFKVKKFVQISTDEVYGSLGSEGKFTEQSYLSPRSPYSASKTAADLLALSFFHTYEVPVVVTRCSNNYGPYQFPEKLIPLMILNALEDNPLPVYGDGLNVRDWIHVSDHCEAVIAVLEHGIAGQVYNIGGNNEIPNINLIKMILAKLGKPEDLITYVTDRPGHDRRYAIDSTKIRTELGWEPKVNFTSGLDSTIEWYVNNSGWWKKILMKSYQ